jgi:hypothetical protein
MVVLGLYGVDGFEEVIVSFVDTFVAHVGLSNIMQ